jgi:hypothetical protein
MLDPTARQHFARLIAESKKFPARTDGNGQLKRAHDRADALGWLASASQLVRAHVSDPTNVYRERVEAMARSSDNYFVHNQVEKVASLIARLADDIDAGLLGSPEDRASAATFDDLLDHARAYLDDGRKDPGGVLAGVVFEDSARRTFRNVSKQDDAGKDLESIINYLKAHPVGNPTISGTQAKRAKVAADVRTQATHARWPEFTASDVEETIKFTREFIEKHLA